MTARGSRGAPLIWYRSAFSSPDRYTIRELKVGSSGPRVEPAGPDIVDGRGNPQSGAAVDKGTFR